MYRPTSRAFSFSFTLLQYLQLEVVHRVVEVVLEVLEVGIKEIMVVFTRFLSLNQMCMVLFYIKETPGKSL